MKTAIRYYSKTGNTKKLAEAIAGVAGEPACTLDTPIAEPVDILFFGSAVYAAGVDAQVKAFIAALDPALVGKVVCFSTAALLASTYPQVKKLFAQRGIAVDDREFHCRGKFKFAHASRPNAEDIQQVKQFTQGVLKG